MPGQYSPSQINVLVPGFQEPLTADLLSDLISIHKINVLFDVNVWFDATNGIPGWALIYLSQLNRVLWRSQRLLRCLHLGNPLLIWSQIPIKDEGTLGVCPPWWGEALSIPSLGDVLIGDRITYILVSLFCEPLCSCMCVYLNSARVTVVFWHRKLKCLYAQQKESQKQKEDSKARVPSPIERKFRTLCAK